MAVVEELRERIVRLDSEIKLQKELLQKLESDKSLVQRQLNNVLDPMTRLPLEISSEIFLQSLPFFPEPGVHRVPMLFLAVCNAWAQIALSTPALWAAIHISLPCARAWKSMIPIWLQRARSQPLSVSLQVAKGFDEDVLPILEKHGHQLKHLELHGRWREDDIFGGASPEPIREGFSLRRTLELLQLAPNLECLVANTNILLDVNIEKLVHPKLRRLIFGNNESWPHGGLELLMSLPSLETLSMDLTSGTLLLFLKESSPPLVELIIGEADNLGFDELSQCLGLVPHLRRLEMWFPRYSVVEKLITALAGSPSLLPHLRTLGFRLDEYDDEAEVTPLFWTTLAGVLTARRIHLQDFRFKGFIRPPAANMPTPETVTAFRDLRTHGIQVSIMAACGTWDIFD